MKAVELSSEVQRDIERMQPEVIDLIRTLCAIPAPSHHEEKRAAFIRDWFAQHGMDASIDEAKNVLCPMGVGESGDIVVVMAHTDTVFPDTEPMPRHEADGRLYCPGVGDDTTNLAALMMMAAYLHEHGMQPDCGVLFVANSCEEGLGNLKGCKAIMKAYGPRVKAFLSLDGGTEHVCARAVGSSRYRITAKTCGGHSFADFGNRNASAVLAELTCALYAQPVPRHGDSLTTYNVGVISGGTSVNTIAQHAEMLYEYRSDDAQCLDVMEKQLREVLAAHEKEDAQVTVELLGLRPIIQLNFGVSKVVGKVRGNDAVPAAMIKHVLSRVDDVSEMPYQIGYTDCEEAAKELAKQCKKAFGHEPENFFHLGGVVSCNTGPDALAIAYLNAAHKE